jgi:hypothetical protein
MAEKGPFAIAYFSSDKSVEVVSTSWIINDTCYWPTIETQGRLKKAVKSHKKVESTWKIHKIKVFKYYGKFTL